MADPKYSPNSGYSSRVVVDPATGRFRWVPINSADTRVDPRGPAGAGMALNEIPIPFLPQAVDGIMNVAGSLTTGAANASPSLGAMMFGRASKAPAAPAPPAAPGVPALSFTPQVNAMTPTSFRATAGGPTLASMEAQVAAPKTAAEFLAMNLPGVQVTGTDRTVERNAEVGGAKNSHHLQAGRAVDFAPPAGMSIGDVRAIYERAGWTVHEAIDETKKTNGTGPHFHIAASPPGGGSGSTSASGGPQFAGMDPRTAMGMIPAAQLVTPISLPDAPQMELPVARPQHLMIDKQTFLGPLAQAMEIPQRDRSRDAWERVSAMLGSAASAMVGQTDTSDMILAGGGAAQKGFQSERDAQRELDRVDENNRRAARTALAKAGLDVDLANLATQNTNLDRGWQDKMDTAQTKFGNLTANHQVAVQEIMANLGIRQFNAGAQNQNNMARAQVGLGVMESNLQSQNRSTELGWTSQQQRQQLVDQTQARLALSGGITNTAGLLGAVGIPLEPVRGETPGVTNARATAGYVAAGNTAMAVNGLASEMVMTGSYAELLGEAEAKAVQKLIQQENVAGAAMIVGQTLNAALNGPEAAKVVTAIDELAGRGGHPSAQIISAARTRSTEATQPK